MAGAVARIVVVNTGSTRRPVRDAENSAIEGPVELVTR
jgi:hypothetical protein